MGPMEKELARGLSEMERMTEGKIESLKATIGSLRDQVKGTTLSAKEL